MKSSPLKALHQSAEHHPVATRRTLRGLMFGAAVALLYVTPSVQAQTAYTWTSSSTGGSWTTNSNWTPTGVPGGNAGDTATLTNSTTTRDITLGASETIAGLTYVQTTSGVTNELEIDASSGNNPIVLTNSSALALGGASAAGKELLYLNGTVGNAAGSLKGVATYAGAINIGTNGVLELGSNSNAAFGSVTGAVTASSGSIINADQNISTSSGTPTFASNLTINSGATLNINSANPTTAPTVTGSDTRVNINGNLLVAGGTITNLFTPGTGGTVALPTAELYIGGANVATAEFDTNSTVTHLGTTGTGGILYTGGRLGTSTTSPGFTLTSDITLPIVQFSPAVTGTTNTQYVSVGAVTSGGTFSAAGITFNVAAGNTQEITFTSNVTLGSSTVDTNDPFHATNSSGGTFIFNLNGQTIDTTANSRAFSATGGYSYTITGGGTVKATFFNLSSATGGGTGGALGPNGIAGSTVSGNTIFQANGTGTVAGNNVNNLGNATGGTIDPTSTFLYTGVGSATLTSNRPIGRLAVGNGSASVLSLASLATANLSVGGDTAVSTNGVLDLAGFSLTQTGANAAAGGLTGTGTVRNNTTGTAATLTLNTPTGVSSTFAGTIINNTTGTGTIALTTTGAGTQILSGTMSTYSGGTTITGGTLLVNSATGSGTGTGAVLVAGGTLGGTGQINAVANTISIGGTATGGTATGGTITGGTPTVPTGMLTLTTTATAGVVFNGTSTSLATYLVNINGANSSNLAISGALTLTGAYDHITISGTPTASSYDLIYYTGALTGTFTELAGDLPAGYQLSYSTPDEIELVATPVPEPSTWLAGVFSVGIAGFAFNKRRHAATVNGASAWAA